jgi:hypothetical protein
MNDGNRQNYNNNAMINDNRNIHSFMTIEPLQHHSKTSASLDGLRVRGGSCSGGSSCVGCGRLGYLMMMIAYKNNMIIDKGKGLSINGLQMIQ